jgi:general secretion pathway protein D
MKGAGKLMTVSYKFIGTSNETEISVIGVTPIGSSQAIGRPGLPIVHKLTVTP